MEFNHNVLVRGLEPPYFVHDKETILELDDFICPYPFMLRLKTQGAPLTHLPNAELNLKIGYCKDINKVEIEMIDLLSVRETPERKERPHWARCRVEQEFHNVCSVTVYFGKT